MISYFIHLGILRQHASMFGDLWWPGDAVQLRLARGVGTRSLCRRIHPNKVNNILYRWCHPWFHAGNCGHHAPSIYRKVGHFFLGYIFRKARLQSPKALAMEPSGHVLRGQCLFSGNHDCCVAAGLDGFLER